MGTWKEVSWQSDIVKKNLGSNYFFIWDHKQNNVGTVSNFFLGPQVALKAPLGFLGSISSGIVAEVGTGIWEFNFGPMKYDCKAGPLLQIINTEHKWFLARYKASVLESEAVINQRNLKAAQSTLSAEAERAFLSSLTKKCNLDAQKVLTKRNAMIVSGQYIAVKTEAMNARAEAVIDKGIAKVASIDVKMQKEEAKMKSEWSKMIKVNGLTIANP